MTTDKPAVIVNVSLAGSDRDYDKHVTFLEQEFHLRRIGTNGDVAAAEELVRKWADDADVIAVTGIREARVAGLYDGDLEAVNKVKRATRMIPVTDGHALRAVLQEWSIRHVQNEMPGYYTNARVVVLGGMNHAGTIRILQEYTQNFEFADPLLRLDVLKRMDSNPVLGLAANVGMWPVRQLPGAIRSQVKAPGHRLSSSLARRALADAHVIVGTPDELSAFGVGNLRGKSVVTTALSDERLAELAALDVDMVLDSTPQPFDFTITTAVLEAMMLAASSSPLGRLTNDDLLDMIVSSGLEPRVIYPNGFRRRSRFAFVIHPLSQRFLTNVEPLRTIERVSPRLRDGRRREGHGVRTADEVRPDHRRHLTHRRRGRGLAAHRGRHAQGAAVAQPGVHLLAPARGRGQGQEAGRPDHGPRRVHEGRRRRRRHRGQAGVPAHHHRQQLQRIRRPLGRARGARAPRPVRGRRARPDQGQGDGRRAPPARSAPSAPASWRWPATTST